MCVNVLSHFSCVRLCETLGIVTCQDPLSMEFSRQEYWSRLPCPPPGDLPYPGIKSHLLRLSALAGRFFAISATWEAQVESVGHFKKSDFPGECSLVDQQWANDMYLKKAFWTPSPERFQTTPSSFLITTSKESTPKENRFTRPCNPIVLERYSFKIIALNQ